MRETTRRTICRFAFVIVCLGPTLGVLGLIGFRNSPLFARQQRAAWEQRIHSETGLLAAIGHVSYPRGGVTLLHAVTLSDPDSRRDVLRTRMLEFGQTAQGLVILLSQPEVCEGQFLRLWEAFHERILRGIPPATAVHLRAAEATLLESPRPLTLTDVIGSVVPHRDGLQSAARFRVAGLEMNGPAELLILRDRQGPSPATHWEWRTGPTPLPCSLLARYCSPINRLGPNCRFQGVARAVIGTSGWQADIAGLFFETDLACLMEPFPHKLTGMASLKLDHARFQAGRLAEAAGTLDCPGGVISRSLVLEFAKAFGAETAPREQQAEQPLLEYAALGIGFLLDGQGLRVFGLCDREAAGVLLTDQQGPLVVENQSGPVPAMILAQALAPEADLHIPATEETHLLLQTLPLPTSGHAAPRTADRPAYSPVRLQQR